MLLAVAVGMLAVVVPCVLSSSRPGPRQRLQASVHYVLVVGGGNGFVSLRAALGASIGLKGISRLRNFGSSLP